MKLLIVYSWPHLPSRKRCLTLFPKINNGY
jgi:hypothetical protein